MSDTIETKIKDSWQEHSQHDYHIKDCSLCHTKKKRITDGILLLAKQQKYEIHFKNPNSSIRVHRDRV